ncbi:unnamed protein product [Paramecium octaurelia]|uniref:CCR4-NOT transcription complex subunit 1 n=1 Tax=Paramecium octaurelia TaxID=43137 RepID=A0A8S1T127_PAROT|nr:unnamed protein product [Paramecium octaurelia]
MNYVSRSPQVPIYQQIKAFVQGLAQKRNQKVVLNEVQSLINQLGIPGEQYFLLQLLESIEVQKEKQSLTQKGQFLVQWLQQASSKSHFIDYFCGVVEAVCPQSQSITEYLCELCNALKVPSLVQMIMWLSITFSSNQNFSKEGIKMLKKKLQEPFQQKNNLQVPQYVIHTLLYQLRNIPELSDLEQEIKNFNEYVQNTKQADLKCLYDDGKKYMKLDPVNIEIPKINECIKPVDILRELGPYTSNLSQIFTEYTDSDIMDCLLYLANNQGEDASKEAHKEALKDVQQLFKLTSNTQQPDWNQLSNELNKQQEDDFIKFFINDNNKRQWSQVFEKLDRPNLQLSQQGYNNLMGFLAKIKKQQQQFQLPHRLLLDKWHNKKSQITFLTCMLKANKPEQLFWNEIQPKKLVIMEHNTNYKNQQQLQYWYNLEFVQMLIELSEYGYIAEIREFFEQPIKQNPDLIILALFQISPTQGGALIDELFTQLFPNYVSQHANSSPVLEQMWKFNQNLFITGISELYKKEYGKKENSCLNLSRVLDIVQQLFQNSQQNNTSLLTMAKFDDYQFSVPLGILAGKREYLNFDIWLNERIKSQGIPFVNVLLQYIDENVIQQIKEYQLKAGLPNGQLGQMQIQQLDQILDKGQLKLEMITIIFEQLMNQGDKLGNKIKQTTQQFYKEVVQVFPQLAGQPNQKTNQEVESKTDSYFESYYNEQISLENFLNQMVQWKTQGSIQEKEVYACIITNLYNEYQFHLKYPKKELELTGQLFGGVLERGLVEGQSIQIGLRIIQVSLKNNTQRYDFAVKALEVMKNKIYEWPWFAQDVMACEQLSFKNPDLLAEIIRVCEKHGIKSPLQPAPPIQPVFHKPLQLVAQKEKQEEEPVQLTLKKSESVPVQQAQPTPIVVPAVVQPVQIPIQYPQPVIVPQQQPVTQVQQHQQVHLQSVTPPPTLQKSSQLPVQHTPQPQKQKQEDNSTNINLTYKQILQLEFDEFQRCGADSDVKEYFTFTLNSISQNNVEQKAAEIRNKLENQDALFYFIKTIAYLRSPMAQQQAQGPNVMCCLLAALNKSRYFSEVAKEVSKGLTRLLTFNKTSPSADDRSTIKNMGSFLGQITVSRDKPFLFKYFDYKTLLKQNQLTIYPLCKILEQVKSSQIFTKNNKWVNRILQELDTAKETCNTMAKYEIMNLLKQIEYTVQPINPTPTPITIPNPVVPIITQPIVQPIMDLDPLNKLNIKNLPQYVMADSKNLNDKLNEADCKNLVATALDHAISDIIPPVISRSVTIALITTRELVFKDFALEPNEKYMLRGMHMIASHLSGSLAMVTCREPLKVRITHYLKEGIEQIDLDNKTKETFVQTAAQENLDLGCALIRKAVIERALEDVNQDPSILEQLEKRQRCKEKGQQYRDEITQNQLKFLPEPLQPRISGLTEEEIRIYEEFGNKKKQPKQSVLQKVSTLCQLLQDPQSNEEKIQQLIQDLNEQDQSNPEQFYKDLADKFLQVILTNNLTSEKISISLDLITILIRKINEKVGKKWSELVTEFITKNIELLEHSPLWWQAFPIMLNKRLIQIQEAEQVMTQILAKDNQMNVSSIVFILRKVIIEEDNNTYLNQFRNIAKELSKKKDTNPTVSKFFLELTSYVSNASQTKVFQKKLNLIKGFYQKIDEEFSNKVSLKLKQWYQLSSEEEFSNFFRVEGESQFFVEDQLSKFCAYAIELSMTDVNKEYMDHSQIEQLGKMLTIMSKGLEPKMKPKFFEKLFDGCLMVLTKLHEVTKQKFNQRQLFKLFYNLLFDLQILDEENIRLFHNKFAEFLEKVEPSLYPGFSYAWLELLCNRYFQQIITTNENAYARLIIKLLEFVRDTITEETIQYHYVQEYLKGVTRLFMLLLTDQRKFCSKYAFSFADEVPFNHVQLLNLSLAAYPNDQTDDPQSCTNIYDIADAQQFGQIVHACFEESTQAKIKEEIQYMLNMSDEDLKIKISKYFDYDQKSKLPCQISGFFILLPRHESLTIQQQRTLLTRIIKNSSYAIRNNVMNVILNQIRYPERATEFYIRYILQQFIVGDNFQIQEQFTTLITKRFLSENPKTWGMLYLHEELKRTQSNNNQYKMYQIQRQ